MTTSQTAAARRVTYQLETCTSATSRYGGTSRTAPSGHATASNSFLFQENLMPRLQRLGLIFERIAPRYREIGLLT